MKKIYLFLFALLGFGVTFTSCNDEEPFSTASADDDPRILDPIFPDRENGELPVVSNINRDANFSMTLTVTPADYTTVVWFIDGKEVHTGKEIDTLLYAGTYPLKVTATTLAGKSTYREGIIKVNPLSDDPWSIQNGFERIIAPQTTSCLYGTNLENVKGITIGNVEVTSFNLVSTENGAYLEYVVPELPEGEHRVVFTDAEGNKYGANTVKVSYSALITSGAERTNANSEWTMNGINLDQISSLNIDGKEINTFIAQSATSLTVTCPDLTDGEYKLIGKTKDGGVVKFYQNNNIVEEMTTVVSSERVLWEGHHYVSWDLPDDNPNKTFNLIGLDVFSSLKAGAVMKIHYSIAPEAEYHQMRTTTGWWNDLPGTAAFDFSENGVKELTLTQEMLDMIQAESGFLCVGHGYYVDLVTVQ